MPKDEFDFADPMELNGVGLGCAEETTAAMTECFVEEFIRLGYDHRQILALFRNPHYIGMNLALRSQGEAFVRDVIGEVFARRGKTATWPAADGVPTAGPRNSTAPEATMEVASVSPPAVNEVVSTGTDPLGVPVPKLNS